MFKNMGLRTKLLLSICTLLFLSLTVSIAVISIKTYDLSRRLAMEKTEAMAEKYATEIRLELEQALSSSRTLADVFAGLKSFETLPDRNSLSHMMKEIVIKNPGFDGVWTVCYIYLLVVLDLLSS